METKHFRGWFNKKVNIYNEIAEKYNEVEAEILLCCAVSGLIAKVWTGEGIDKCRFIEFLIDSVPSIKTISVPVLVAGLRKKNLLLDAQKIIQQFYPNSSSLVVTCSQIDQQEDNILQIISITKKELRKSSYGGIIYKDLRCGLVHLYNLPEHMSAWGMSQNKNEPSYVNKMILQDEQKVKDFAEKNNMEISMAHVILSENVKQLYIPYEYLCNVLSSSANKLFTEWDSAGSYEKIKPSTWWIEGKD